MNASTLLARLAVDALAAAGVRHVLLCPGSRSAPLAYELDRRSGPDGDGPVLHVRHDERVAAFTALGAGLEGAGPGAVVTTSGTAAANLHPAVLEAHHAGVPLVVVTADRPPALRGTWANQTSELQAGLFGEAVRARLDLADTDAAADPQAARAALAQVLAAARGCRPGDRPGPVHLDLGFSEPLVPADEPLGWAVPDVHGAAPCTSYPHGVTPCATTTALEDGPRTVVVAGDGAGPQAARLADLEGWPLLAEPSSRARFGPNAIAAYRLLLELPELGGRVQRVVAFGRPTLSRPVTALLARADVEVVLVAPYGDWPDPGRPVRRVPALPDPAAGGPALPDPAVGDPALPDPAAGDRDPWLRAWRAAGAAASAALDAVLDDPAVGLTGPLVARELAAALAPGDRLMAAASNPVRDLDLAARPRPFAGPAAGEPAVHANRGLSGIDGTLSTATGLALDGGRVRVLVGDLAFLHDVGALLLGPGQRRPDVQVVVLNDDGGGIFSLLEHGERAGSSPARAATFERVFATPHRADLAALCRGYGVAHQRVADVAGLRAVLAAPAPGTSVVEVRASRAGLRDLHTRIRVAVHEAARAAVRG